MEIKTENNQLTPDDSNAKTIAMKHIIDIVTSKKYITLTRKFNPYVSNNSALIQAYPNDAEVKAKILIDIDNILEVKDSMLSNPQNVNINKYDTVKCTYVYVKNMKDSTYFVEETAEQINSNIDSLKKNICESICEFYNKITAKDTIL